MKNKLLNNYSSKLKFKYYRAFLTQLVKEIANSRKSLLFDQSHEIKLLASN